MKRTLIFLFIFLSPIMCFSVFAHAQTIPVSTSPISLSLSSNNPEPNQIVTITARSYTIEINSANITWTVDGKVVKSGVGATTLDVKAPALGKKLTIDVTATTQDKKTFTGTLSVNSGSVDMILESNGFVPPFFKGKMPIVYQNSYKIVAIPHLANSQGVEYDPKTLVYQWKKNSLVDEDQSGYGKQAMSLTGDIVPRAVTIEVAVSTRDSSASAAGYIVINYSSPSLSFYVDDPLYGPLFNKALGQNLYIGSKSETSIMAIPYGFTKPASGIGDLGLTWMIGGYERPDLSTNQSITLHAPSNSSGSSDVELDVTNSNQILQNFNNSFTVQFNTTAADSASSVNF